MSKSKKTKTPEGPFSALKGLREKMAQEEEAKAAKAKAPRKTEREASKSTAPAGRPTGGTAAGEELEFHRLMAGVRPLEDKGGRVPKVDARGERRAPVTRAPDETMEHLRVLVEEGSKFEVVDDGRRVEGHRVDVPPDFVRKLRRGGFPVDATLDLHGKTADESREALATFLRDKRTRGERCVLVVHGRGLHSPGAAPVLRGEITAWLSQGPASNHVAAFATAQSEDGGAGAVYVLMRR